MEKLLEQVTNVTGANDVTAKRALGFVLLFLRDQAPISHIRETIDKDPVAHSAVAAALAASDGGLTTFIAASHSFQGEGPLDMLALEGELKNIGLDAGQIDDLLTEVLSHADVMIGEDGVEELARRHPELTKRMRPAPRLQR